jgi:lipid II isoglutaminyl synthase (glutamine-hydrolysing)
MNYLLIVLGKCISRLFRVTRVGHGSTWPGHIALTINKHFIADILKKNKIIVIAIAGTNGKTTTTKLIRAILEADGKTVLQNHSGANLLNGIASSLLLSTSPSGKLSAEFALFEVDENVLPQLLYEITPDYLVLLNLFRDQLDRYGEVHTIATKWKKALEKTKNVTVIANADDPQIAYIVESSPVMPFYFGVTGNREQKAEHAGDTSYCPSCGTRLQFHERTFSHLGNWECPNCGLKRPSVTIESSPVYPLLGTYNKYNTHATVLLAKILHIPQETVKNALTTVQPAFGRQEVIEYNGKRIQVFLSKNPTGFNESLRAISAAQAKHVVLMLNDRIPDGQDISWIWDVDFEDFVTHFQTITITGDRCFDMGLRIKYAFDARSDAPTTYTVIAHTPQAITTALADLPQSETLYILPTYSAMLETRKILTGKKIL